MPLQLTDICLLAIYDGVENGTIRHLPPLPLKSRQSILEIVLPRGKIDNPIWTKELSTPEFLRGFPSLNTQCGRIDDYDYLKNVTDSLSSNSDDGQTIGAGITSLCLNLYLHAQSDTVSNLGEVVRLISACPNLNSLSLKIQKIYIDLDVSILQRSLDVDGLLNRLGPMEPCRSVLENLEDLSLMGRYNEPFLIADLPVIDFKKLNMLRVSSCFMDGGRFRDLLIIVRDTLTRLHLRQICMNGFKPFGLPRVNDLIVGYGSPGFLMPFVRSLTRCRWPRLECARVHLEPYALDETFVDEEQDLKLLRRNDAIHVQIFIHDRHDVIPDDLSRFKLVALFNEKIVSFALNFALPAWDRRSAKALENVVDVCENLTSFELMTTTRGDEVDWPERANINSILVRCQLFGNSERASKLRKLEIWFVDLEFNVLTQIFENCINIESLQILYNTHLADEHLIEWARRGARPSKLSIMDCENLTDDGLIPILINSGAKLENYRVHIHNTGRITDRMWRVLMDRCPYVKFVGGMPADLEVLALSKCPHIQFE